MRHHHPTHRGNGSSPPPEPSDRPLKGGALAAALLDAFPGSVYAVTNESGEIVERLPDPRNPTREGEQQAMFDPSDYPNPERHAR